MSTRILSEEQISELLKNENVARCSAKSISYSKTFMVLAVQKYEAGFSAVQIFKEAGFDLSLIGQKRPKDHIGRWRKIYKTQGIDKLKVETRGRSDGRHKGRPKTKGISAADRIKRMEIEIAYLKAENDFLVKLRAAKKR